VSAEPKVVPAIFPQLGRMGEVRDIVDAVPFLETAGFVTGEILHVDGE
jgi:NAD(P)-dependent dehydrogenase (short-subunit alcohol dehydrogenase family)